MNCAIDRKLARIQRDLEDVLNMTHEYDYESATTEQGYAVQGKREAIVAIMSRAAKALARNISADVDMHLDTTKRLNTTPTTSQEAR
jgi:hypothetical protein